MLGTDTQLLLSLSNVGKKAALNPFQLHRRLDEGLRSIPVVLRAPLYSAPDPGKIAAQNPIFFWSHTSRSSRPVFSKVQECIVMCLKS
ncbi:hypothetical protein EBU02_07860 [bacterium]|nr:hypothetical protein [bacterium]NBS52325.1 hypothetical protein [Spartobacteria bacterium]